jgi:pilus assembly protein CpaB
MWKVKRMNTACIVILTPAAGAGGIAAYFASGSGDTSLPTAPLAQLQTVDALVAKPDIGLGRSVTPEDVQWQTWPAAPKLGDSVNVVRYGVSTPTTTLK